MPPVIAIVGQSDSGKTTLITKLVPELKKRGYRVGTIKHATCRIDIDQEGKDSWRHRQAGADTVIAASRDGFAMTSDREADGIDNLLPLMHNRDVVIAEGFKREKHPKIEIFRQAIKQSPMCSDDPHLIAIITDNDYPSPLPRFGLEDITALADFIEDRFL